MRTLSIKELLSKLECCSVDEAIDLVSSYQCGALKIAAREKDQTFGLAALSAENTTLKEENERLKEEIKLSEYSANLANNCREEWKATAIKYSAEVSALKARVAELKKQNARLRSTGSPMANAFYNIAQGRSITPQMCADLYKDWDIAVKVEEPANEG